MNSRREDFNVMPTYAGFVTQRLIDIWVSWDQGDYERALSRVIKFCYFLPTEVKKKIRKDHEEIREAYQDIREKRNVGWYSRKLDLNRQKRELAMQYLPAFLDKLVDLLDERGYLEKAGFVRLQKEHFKEFEK